MEQFKKMFIPIGESKEDVNARKQIIRNFYEEWKKNNPTQRKYNNSLKDDNYCG